jgi:adenosylcobinamide amidohydrolase
MTPLPDGEALLEGVTLTQVEDVLRVTSRTPLRVLGSSNIGDDLALTRNILAMSGAAAGPVSESEQRLHNWAMEAGIQEPYVGVVSGGDVRKYEQVCDETDKWKLYVLVVADISTRCSAGVTMPKTEAGEGGIDIIVLTDASLSMGAMVSAMVTATEAKVRTFMENQVITSEGHVATSAPHDSVVIACLSRGERFRHAGPTTQIGYLVGKLVHQGLHRALQGQQSP